MAAESGPISREKNLKSRTGRRGDAPIGTTRRAPETATGRAGARAGGRTGNAAYSPERERSEHGAELSWGNGAGVGTEGVSAWGGWRCASAKRWARRARRAGAGDPAGFAVSSMKTHPEARVIGGGDVRLARSRHRGRTHCARDGSAGGASAMGQAGKRRKGRARGGGWSTALREPRVARCPRRR